MKVTYGSVVKVVDGFQVQFYNPILKHIEKTKYFTEKEDADLFLQECNFIFFSENPTFLPKGISLNRSRKSFNFCVTIMSKTVRVYTSKNLDDVCNYKFLFVQSFLS